MTWGAIRVAILFLCLTAAGSGIARAQPFCSDAAVIGRTVPGPDGGPPIQIVGWQDTVCLEHGDRVRRIERLAQMLPADGRPVFRQYMLPRDRLPPTFASGMPLLRIIFPEKSFFETGSSGIRAEAQLALGLIAASLRNEVPDVAVFVAGHTDSRGEEDYNYNLSVERADSVARRLAEMGVGGVALWRVGFGEAVPLQPNDSEQGLAVNRRVEFVIGARTEPVATWLSDQTPRFCAGRAEAVETCSKPLKRREFEAVAVTERTGMIAPLRVPPAIKAPIDKGKRVEVAVRASAPQRVDVAKRARIVIPLSNQKRKIPAPLG
jgi:outer membrane protein OmpA-like peptidoglycan-associated protein